MFHSTLRTTLPVLAGAISIAFLSSCQSTVWTPAASVSAVRESAGAFDTNAPAKTFVIKRDWQDGDWIVKKGAKITFRQDGLGSFSGRIYTLQAARKQEFHFQSVQYGRDGNLLFTAPAADLGYSIHARNAEQDYAVDFDFGFDARHFAYIERVLYTARIRKPKNSAGSTANRASTPGEK
jgi:hypothetical protein